MKVKGVPHLEPGHLMNNPFVSLLRTVHIRFSTIIRSPPAQCIKGRFWVNPSQSLYNNRMVILAELEDSVKQSTYFHKEQSLAGAELSNGGNRGDRTRGNFPGEGIGIVKI